MTRELRAEGSAAAPRPAELALSWSGGRDSSLALWKLRQARQPPSLLITTMTEPYDRISIHGVRRELLAQQAAALGLPVVEVAIPAGSPNDVYEARMRQALAAAPLAGITTIAFGDLFLTDVRAYREEQLAAVGRRAVFPLWGSDTAALARQFLAADFAAVIVCVDPGQLDASFAGRRYDAQLLHELPSGVDPCGENGEFHTFVYAGPIFSRAVACEVGAVIARDNFVFCDLTPA